jgi:Major Facilitator Superfamily
MATAQSKTGRLRTSAVGDGAAGRGQQGRRPGLALAVIATAQLMVVLDATIVNVALPRIQGALGFSGSGLEWVVNAYALTFGGLLLLGGRAGDILGRRRMFVIGIILFSAASMFGGLATSQAWLLAARCRASAARSSRRPRCRWSRPTSPRGRRATGPWAGTRR